VPGLRQRPEDLPYLILAMARRYRDIYRGIESVEPELLSHLSCQRFPGNVRELEHAVQRMLFQKTSGATLTLADWMAQERGQDVDQRCDSTAADGLSLWKRIVQGDSYSQVLNEVEHQILEAALASGGTRREIAKLLHISERKLYNKIRTYRLNCSVNRVDSCTEPAQSGTAPKSLSHMV
jgi:DNA-binding NtrC family response regulator